MEKLQEVMNEVFVEYEQSGKIKELFEKNIENCIEKVVEEEFSRHGSARASITAQIRKVIPTDLGETANLMEYNHVLSTILKSKLEAFFSEEATRTTESLIDSLLESPPKEVTLHQLAKAFIVQHQEDAEREGWERPVITIEEDSIISSCECYKVTFKTTDDTTWSEDVELNVMDGKVYHVLFDEEASYKKRFEVRRVHALEFEKLVFQLYTCGAKLVRGDFDEDDYSYPERY